MVRPMQTTGEYPMGSPTKLSPDGFEQLLERAIRIDAEGRELIDHDRAREIASELGVSEAAWNAALLERTEALARRRDPDRRAFSIRRLGLAIASGGIAGGIMGVISAASAGNDILVGGAVIGAAVTLGAYESIRSSLRQAHAGLAGWWLAAGVGITLGLREPTSDVGWYVALSWTGCALAIAGFDVLRRRSKGAPNSGPPAASMNDAERR